MYDPCSSCPKGEYSQPCCSVQCSYGRDLDELKMLREQTKKLAEVVGGELVQSIDADTCAIENLQTLLRNDFHAIGIVTVIRAINALNVQRADTLDMRIMKMDVKTPETGVKTSEGVPLWIDSVVTAQVYSDNSSISEEEMLELGVESKIDYITARQQMAISNFLGMEEEEINEKVNDVLQGNLREIVAEMSVMDVLTKRKEFAQRVMENSRPDLAKMGLEVVTFTIQDVKDAVDSCGESHGVVEAIGVQREMEVKRDAANARAAADRDIKIAEANAAKEANDAEVASKKAIAEKNNELALRQAELKAAEDKAAAEADAAGKIEEQVQAKTIKERTADAEIAAETKKIELAARAAEVEHERLNAEVQKKADAALYESQRKADAQEYAQRKNADAALYAKQQEAEGIRKVAEAEAAGIKAKGIAEAEAMEKKAEAYKKYGQAAMAEMVVKILPDMAAQVAKSIEQIDKITIYGSDESAANSVDGVAGNVPTLLAKTFDTVKDATGIDLVDIVNAQSYDAQVNRHVKLDVASLPDMNKQSSQGTELKSNDTPDTPADKR